MSRYLASVGHAPAKMPMHLGSKGIHMSRAGLFAQKAMFADMIRALHVRHDID